MSKGKIGMRIGESVFCIAYLMFDFIATILFLKNGSNRLFLLYGIMTFILGFGDAFHLIPRVIRNIKGETEKIQWWMNFGLLITSITMTVFYVILFYIWKKLNVNLTISSIIPISIWITALTRITLCLLPQNDWFKNGNKKLSVCRNFVFTITGLIETILFMLLGNSYGITMAICILLSFVFYIPVTLYAKENPKIGMLMILKTIMYIIMISLGLSLL